MLNETRAVLFFKKLPRGRQTAGNSQGLFIQRNPGSAQEWSQPIAVHMASGDLYWGNSPRVDRTDIFVLVQDAAMVDAFAHYAQLGFDADTANKMKKGCCIENSEINFIRFATVLSERPDLCSGAAFAYGVHNGHIFPVDIESPIFQLRETSTSKFYGVRRNVDLPTLLQRGLPIHDLQKSELVGDVRGCLARHFNIDKRFPAYAGQGGAAEASTAAASTPAPSPQPQQSAMSPLQSLESPDPARPSLGRQWSDSACSSSSERDDSFRGYIPGASDEYFAASNLPSALGPMVKSPPTPTATTCVQQSTAAATEEPMERVRATSFDFSA